MSSQSENGGAQAPVGSAVTSSGAPSAQEASRPNAAPPARPSVARGDFGGTHFVLPASRPVFGRAVFPGRSERTRSTLSVLSGESVPSSPILVPLLRTVQNTHPEEDLSVLELSLIHI